MKPLLLSFFLVLITSICAYAQNSREIDGTVIDSTKLSVPGASVKLVSDKGDTTVAAADANGKFVFPGVTGIKFTLIISSIGYQQLIRHYALDNDTKPAVLDPIILKNESNALTG